MLSNQLQELIRKYKEFKIASTAGKASESIFYDYQVPMEKFLALLADLKGYVRGRWIIF